jgi:hypothetical protein
VTSWGFAQGKSRGGATSRQQERARSSRRYRRFKRRDSHGQDVPSPDATAEFVSPVPAPPVRQSAADGNHCSRNRGQRAPLLILTAAGRSRWRNSDQATIHHSRPDQMTLIANAVSRCRRVLDQAPVTASRHWARAGSRELPRSNKGDLLRIATLGASRHIATLNSKSLSCLPRSASRVRCPTVDTT